MQQNDRTMGLAIGLQVSEAEIKMALEQIRLISSSSANKGYWLTLCLPSKNPVAVWEEVVSELTPVHIATEVCSQVDPAALGVPTASDAPGQQLTGIFPCQLNAHSTVGR